MTRSIERRGERETHTQRGRERGRTAACFVGVLQIGCELAERKKKLSDATVVRSKRDRKRAAVDKERRVFC